MMTTKNKNPHSIRIAGHVPKSSVPNTSIGLPIDARNTVNRGQSAPRLASLYPKAELDGLQMTKKNMEPTMMMPRRMRKGAMSRPITCGAAEVTDHMTEAHA